MGHLVINRVKVVHKDDLRVSDRILQSVSVSELMNEGARERFWTQLESAIMSTCTDGQLEYLWVWGEEKKKKRIAFNSAE